MDANSLWSAEHCQLASEVELNLTIKLTEVPRSAPPSDCAIAGESLLVCERCQNFEEVVVAIMHIVQLDETWALCGTCARELPTGYHMA
jgi:hypothetical protein